MSTTERAAEAETLTAEAEHEHEQKPQTVGGLSDTVFGLAITLLGTSLSISTRSSLAEILQQLGGFAAAFFIIALIWLRRHQLLRWMRHEPIAFTRLNFVLLFLIIFYTYILRLLTLSTNNSSVLLAFSLFVVLTVLVNTTLALLYQYALRAGVVMQPYRQRARQIRTDLLLTAAGFVLVLPFIFWDWHNAIGLLSLVFVARVIRRAIRRRKERKAAPRAAPPQVVGD